MAKTIKNAAAGDAPPQARTAPAPANRAMHADRVMVVRTGRILLYPDGSKRGGAGYCVRANDPFIKGYEHVLDEAPEGSQPDQLGRIWQEKLRVMQRQPKPPEPKTPKVQAFEEQAERVTVDDELPEADA